MTFAPALARRGFALGKGHGRRLACAALIGAVALTAASQAEAQWSRSPESKAGIAEVTPIELADTAFPRWAAAHPQRACPADLMEVVRYSGYGGVYDPYGVAYWWSCQRTSRGPHFVVGSVGEDGVRGTADDTSSDHVQLRSVWSMK